MTDLVRPVSTQTLSELWGRVERNEFDLRRRDGSWQRQVRETYDSGDGAAVLLCDLAAGDVVLTRQFRYPAFRNRDTPFLIEACAGKLDGDDPETCARREAEEETGHVVETLQRVCLCYSSPGSVTERLTLFVGTISGPPRLRGGGLEHEGEDIEVLRLPFAHALAMVATGEIIDAKTIVLLQHAALTRLFEASAAS